ncbi:MAG: hypothetical protein WC835_02125 [Candidatus Paceibacterota bacterium]|jgi:hypothetical protein
MSNNIIKNAAINAMGTALYVALVATFLSNTQYIFGRDGGDPKSVLVPIAMLLLLILSAAITGSLVLGKPILWYLDGKKKEALSLLAYTLGDLFIIMIIVWIILYMTIS